MTLNTNMRISKDVISNIILPYTVTSIENKIDQFNEYIISLFYKLFGLRTNRSFFVNSPKKRTYMLFNSDFSEYSNEYMNWKVVSINVIIFGYRNKIVIEFAFTYIKRKPSCVIDKSTGQFYTFSEEVTENLLHTFKYKHSKDRCINRMRKFKVAFDQCMTEIKYMPDKFYHTK